MTTDGRGKDPLRARAVPRISALTYLMLVLLCTALAILIFVPLRNELTPWVPSWLDRQKSVHALGDSFYRLRIAPVLSMHCTSCHGPVRQKGRLRVDSYAYLVRGGKHGPVIEPGHPQGSEIYLRITLPGTDDKVMPPQGKTRLSTDESKVIELWIAAGASVAQRADEIKGAPPVVTQVVFPEVDEAAVAKQRAQLLAEVHRLSAEYPGVLAYESRASADIELDASRMGAAFGDSDLKRIVPLAERVVRADFSHTSISDSSSAILSQMRRLRALRLGDTQVTDKIIQSLYSLRALRSLTVFGTTTTESSLDPLKRRGIRVYGSRQNEGLF
jgi:Planctomycete cytochrome C